jgi:hypothetical protein
MLHLLLAETALQEGFEKPVSTAFSGLEDEIEFF